MSDNKTHLRVFSTYSLADAGLSADTPDVTSYRMGSVAELLGVSVDTVRRWADGGRLATTRSESGKRIVEGAVLAAFVAGIAQTGELKNINVESARNHFPGIITKVLKDGVAAHVEIQAGPHRLVSLMTREAADELQLEPGMLAVAAVKSTNVVIELPRES